MGKKTSFLRKHDQILIQIGFILLSLFWCIFMYAQFIVLTTPLWVSQLMLVASIMVAVCTVMLLIAQGDQHPQCI